MLVECCVCGWVWTCVGIYRTFKCLVSAASGGAFHYFNGFLFLSLVSLPHAVAPPCKEVTQGERNFFRQMRSPWFYDVRYFRSWQSTPRFMFLLCYTHLIWLVLLSHYNYFSTLKILKRMPILDMERFFVITLVLNLFKRMNEQIRHLRVICYRFLTCHLSFILWKYLESAAICSILHISFY